MSSSVKKPFEKKTCFTPFSWFNKHLWNIYYLTDGRCGMLIQNNFVKFWLKLKIPTYSSNILFTFIGLFMFITCLETNFFPLNVIRLQLINCGSYWKFSFLPWRLCHHKNYSNHYCNTILTSTKTYIKTVIFLECYIIEEKLYKGCPLNTTPKTSTFEALIVLIRYFGTYLVRVKSKVLYDIDGSITPHDQ